MKKSGIDKDDARFYLPPFEWYNDSISSWTRKQDLQLINYSPGTISHADYTTPDMKNYRSTESIFRSITDFEEKSKHGLNGFILLIHIGTDPKRTDKFYDRLSELMQTLEKRGYSFVRVDELLRGE
jgi:peptidoglycan/xylan/chitin deacetylase (PgdA/CDA1 family)